jgi:hypothetical protein
MEVSGQLHAQPVARHCDRINKVVSTTFITFNKIKLLPEIPKIPVHHTPKCKYAEN